MVEQPTAQAAAGKPAALRYGTIATTGPDVAGRLAHLAARLRAVIVRDRPDCMAIERVFCNANVRTAMTVGQASGVALLVAAEHGLPVVSYTPSEVKRTVTGTGSAPKAQIGYMVTAMLRLPATPRPADSADALAVAICHLHHTAAAGRADGVAGGPTVVGAATADDWLRRAAPTSPWRSPSGVPRSEGRGP